MDFSPLANLTMFGGSNLLRKMGWNYPSGDLALVYYLFFYHFIYLKNLLDNDHSHWKIHKMTENPVELDMARFWEKILILEQRNKKSCRVIQKEALKFSPLVFSGSSVLGKILFQIHVPRCLHQIKSAGSFDQQ